MPHRLGPVGVFFQTMRFKWLLALRPRFADFQKKNTTSFFDTDMRSLGRRCLHTTTRRLTVDGVLLLRRILPPFQGLEILWTVDPGRRSQTRFVLGYCLAGFQPF